MPDQERRQNVASQETQLRALRRAARKVADADKRYGELLGTASNADVQEAQREVWAAIKELRKVLDRYA